MTQTEQLTHTERPLLWNAHGHVAEGASTAEEMLAQADLDWNVEMRPLYVESNAGMGDQRVNPVPGRRGIVRTDNDTLLGIARERYVPAQNREVFEFLTNLQDSGEALFEAAWSWRGGEVVGITMKLAQDIEIAGFDKHGIYLLAKTTHDGGGSVQVHATPVRFGCTNMVNFAIRKAKSSFRMIHTKSIEGRVAEARQALDMTFKYVKAYDEVAKELLTRPVTADDLKKWGKEVFGEKRADSVVDHWQTVPNLGDVRNTRYGALNALTEYAQWVRPRQATPQLESALSGDPAKASRRAFALVTASD